MKTKVNFLTIFLILMILSMGGLSFFIVLKIKEEKPATLPTQTKAASITYRKLIALNQTPPIASSTPSPIPTEASSLTPDSSKISPSESPTPTEIQLVTTPLLTPEATITELAYNNLTPMEREENSIATDSPTLKQVIKRLPQSGIYTIPLLIVFFASILILLSFVL